MSTRRKFNPHKSIEQSTPSSSEPIQLHYGFPSILIDVDTSSRPSGSLSKSNPSLNKSASNSKPINFNDIFNGSRTNN